MKTLKVWNGRWFESYGTGSCHIYACAYSRADLKRMIAEWKGYNVVGLEGEIVNYWSEGHWGRQMDGIEPTRGIWIWWEKDRKLTKEFPKE